MATKTYVSRQGDTVDLACMKIYARTKDVTEIVLNANPGLADNGAFLPIGTTISMPEVPRHLTQPPLISLWD